MIRSLQCPEGRTFIMKRLLLFVFCCASAFAQVTTGTLVGTVTDASGGVIAGAKIIVTNEGTGIASRFTTNSSGDYIVTGLPAGSYSVHAEFPAFKNAELTGISLLLNATRRVDIRLETGTAQQSVSVEASAPVVNSETSSISTIYETHAVASLPLNGRTLDRLILITAGNPSDSTANPNLS